MKYVFCFKFQSVTIVFQLLMRIYPFQKETSKYFFFHRSIIEKRLKKTEHAIWRCPNVLVQISSSEWMCSLYPKSTDSSVTTVLLKHILIGIPRLIRALGKTSTDPIAVSANTFFHRYVMVLSTSRSTRTNVGRVANGYSGTGVPYASHQYNPLRQRYHCCRKFRFEVCCSFDRAARLLRIAFRYVL